MGYLIRRLLATLPVASHLLARAAVREAGTIAHVSQAPLVGDDPAQKASRR